MKYNQNMKYITWWRHNTRYIITAQNIEIVMLWVYYTIPFDFSLFWHFWDITFQFLKLRFWRRIIDEGSLPEMRIWSILLIKSDLKWCIHLIEFSFHSYTTITSTIYESAFSWCTCYVTWFVSLLVDHRSQKKTINAVDLCIFIPFLEHKRLPFL